MFYLYTHTHAVICPDFSPVVNGAPVDYSDPTLPRDEGSTITFSCDTGYVLTGNSMLMCTSSGWSGSAPLCTGTGSDAWLRHDHLLHCSYTAVCPDLPTLTNGVINYSPSTTLKLQGNVATHSCDVGYGLSGGSVRTCRSDRTWSGGVITCPRKSYCPV